MWNWIRNFINWLFGTQSETSAEISNGTGIIRGKPPELLAEAPSQTKTETTYQDVDWDNNPPQYQKRKSLLSYQERELYRVLRGQVGDKYHVFAAVRMGDVLWLANETDNRKYFNNQILCKHFDYVLCDKLKFEPVLVIELDDSKHQWHHRWQRDDFKDKACKVAGLPLLRIKVQQDYDRQEIGKQISSLIAQTEGQERQEQQMRRR